MIPNARIDSELVKDLREILTLLALASAVIDNPTTPPLAAKVIAVMAQHTAMAWAEFLTTDIPVVEGGAR
ncbi:MULTISPECIES: hypothetical protein [Pseudomonas syringae group]|uniref:Uncharacterized protein n=4 Tax=Pseudomonas syringae group TaxID=136849 RepID=F3GGX6_PSESJ|nr:MULTISPECIES: hypothetical protein [Pseudomonas syringae group]EGH46326.1 hypothetical protein PSYPI_30081 [Pseudomonas syringae pv. pisi str. 1704B]RMU77958.1 hypothetical protein ALP24_04117 [Pseudomonas syringae pv. aptata]PYD13573.1 hypothetical protein DND62_12050 [Pseudomonas syringae pv. pisi]PYD30981.1 hypothetical protein DND58_14265 [Pseudomonas syringae pv. pisi]PYD34509.1 hypothetical protein DND67_08120 [Pseudomonas syringae pv. pisi]